MKCSLVILLLSLFAGYAAAETALDLTPKNCPDLAAVADIRIKGNEAAQTDMPLWSVGNSFSGKVLRILSRGDKPGGFSARYRFTIKTAGEYRFYGALIHQGTPYGSAVEYRFDSGDWQKIVPVSGRRISWGESNAVNWEALGVRTLNSGEHSLEFRITSKAGNGNWSFMCDGVIGFEVKKKIVLSGLKAEGEFLPGHDLRFRFRCDSGSGPGLAVLKMADTTVTGQNLIFTPGERHFTLHVPSFLGGNTYTVELFTLGDQLHPLARQEFTLPGPTPEVAPTIIADARINGTAYRIELSAAPVRPSEVCAFLFVDDKLYAVDVLPATPGNKLLSGVFSPAFLQAARGRQARVAFFGCPGRPGRPIEIGQRFAGIPAPLPKPMNYGVFTDRNGLAHPWFIDHRWQYFFDGRLYFPVGGMWCPATLISNATDDAVIEKSLAHDLNTLKNLRQHGIDDVYLNLAHVAPLRVRQYFVDLLERQKINYGYQLVGGGGGPIPAFFITRDREKAGGGWNHLARGHYRNGRVEVELPKTYHVTGLLLVPEAARPVRARMISFEDREGRDTRNGIIDLETVADYEKTRKIAVKTDLPLCDGDTVIVIPLLNAKMHHANFWDPEERERILKHLSWIGKIKWGSRLRCFIDPARNETNMLNSTENLRQYTRHINADYACWLEKKYGTIDALRRAWKTPADDFAVASRLIPLRLKNDLFLLDPTSGKAFSADLKTSMAWLDYNDMIRETYAAYNDDLAMALKRMVDVPVVIKSVGVAGSRTHISRKYRGVDGTGYEVYLNQGFPPEAGGGASRAQAEASTHTVWKVGTEMGYSAQVGNGNVKFFKDEAALRMLAHELSLSGVNGFYFFGIDLKPGHLWKNHSYHDFPAGLKWIERIAREYPAPHPKVSPSSFCYPGGFCFWWWTTRWKAVYGYEANTVAQSVRIKGDEWASNTDVLPENFNRVVVNCPQPPFSLRYGPVIGRVIREGKKVVYLGERSDLGAIPELDRYFSADVIRFPDGSTAQVLRRLPGTMVLAEQNGNPWAIRHGKLLIVSRTPVTAGKYNRDQGFRYLDPAWLD